jgi:hypothetical protein
MVPGAAGRCKANVPVNNRQSALQVHVVRP